MNRKNVTRIIAVIAGIVLMASCQKVIKVDLNSSSPRYVIEGNVTDAPGPYAVSITKSVNFDQENNFPAVSNAIVVITDQTLGIRDTLTESTPGKYQTHTITGVTGHKYALYVQTGGSVFTATSTMPARVSIDTMYQTASSFRQNTQVVPVYTDPAGIVNYYHFRQYQNDSETKQIFIRTDLLTDGRTVTQALGGKSLDSGDSVTVYMQSIDSAVYQYYSTLRQTMNQNSGTPANPISNIMGGALGYFSAEAVSVRSLIIK